MPVTDDDKDILKGVSNVIEEDNQVDGREKGDVDINGHETSETDKTSSSALEEKESELVDQKLTDEDIVFVIETLKKKAPFDENSLKIESSRYSRFANGRSLYEIVQCIAVESLLECIGPVKN